MDNMFHNAAAFNQNLCHFGDNFDQYSDVSDMFAGSGCANTNDPASPTGPWCAVTICSYPFTTNTELRDAIKEYLGQGCTSNLNCQARSDYGGAVSPSWCSPFVNRRICTSNISICDADWGLGRVQFG